MRNGTIGHLLTAKATALGDLGATERSRTIEDWAHTGAINGVTWRWQVCELTSRTDVVLHKVDCACVAVKISNEKAINCIFMVRTRSQNC